MAGVWLHVVIVSSRHTPLPVSLEFLLPRVSSGAHLGALRRGSASVSWPALRLPAVKLFLEARDYVGCFFAVSSYVFQVIGKEFAALSPCCSRLGRSAWHQGREVLLLGERSLKPEVCVGAGLWAVLEASVL